LTGASDPEDPSPPAPDPTPDGPAAAGSAASPGPLPATPAHRYLGLTTFSIEGRQAPALFVVGWLATIIGVGLTATVAFGATGLAAAVLSLASSLALSIGLVMLAGSQTIERKAAGAAYAGPSPLLVLIAVIAVSRLIGFVVGVALLPVADRIPVELGDLLGVALQAGVFLAVLRLTIVGPGVLRWSQMGWVGDRAAVIRGLWGGAVLAGPLILVTSLIVVVAVNLAGVAPPSPLPPTGTAAGLVLHLIAGAIIAPVAEEMLFRGFALTAWRQLVGVRGAIVRSSIVFVLAHVLFVSGDTFGETLRIALVAGLVRVPVAFALGWLFVRTGSIWGPIGLHAGFNGILIVLAEAAARA
jgi:membrane protease YdiL (CAAX protease family)